jgi:hypothetical protein
MTRAHKLTATGLVTFGVLAGGLAFAGTPALAGEGLGVTATFGGSGTSVTDPQPLSGPAGVAVDQASGDVYVVDQGNDRVEVFDAAGDYEGRFNGSGGYEVKGKAEAGPAAPSGELDKPEGIAVDNACFYQKLAEPECKTDHPSNGDVYVVDTGHGVIDQFSATGDYVSQIGGFSGVLLGVAVDSSGDLWVYSDEAAEEGEVSKFDEAGALVGTAWDTHRLTTPALAVDSEDNVYLTTGPQNVFKYNASGEDEQATLIRPATGLTVELATSGQYANDMYVDLRSSLAQYGPFGEPFSAPLYSSGARSNLTSGKGIAVDSISHETYVADSSRNLVDVVAHGVTPATAPQTLSASVPGPDELTLEGELKGTEEGYYFTYNDNGTCTGASQSPEGNATGTVKESVKVTGLEPNTPYTFCVVATNVYGPTSGLPVTVPTEVLAPLVEATSVPYAGVFEATIDAKVNPENDTTTCLVEYGESTSYGETAPCEQASVTGHGPRSVSARLMHLKAGTTYDYRVVAEDAAKLASGPSEGTGQLMTAPARDAVIESEAVSVERELVTGTQQREVTLSAQVNPELLPIGSCEFQYVSDATFKATGFTLAPGSVSCEQSSAQIGDGNTSVGVSATIAGLKAGVDYHYRLVLVNEAGTSEGPDEVFGPPTVVTGGVSSETPGVAASTSASVGGEVNPESIDTHYYVEYGLCATPSTCSSSPFTQSAPFLPPGINIAQGIDAGSGVTPVELGVTGAAPEITLEGLSAGTVYHYRLVAHNADGTTYGSPQEVRVLPAPEVGPATVSEITQSSATITTSVNPEGLQTLYKLDFGTSIAYGTPYPGDAGAGTTAVTLTFKLSGLEAGITYHFRLFASNGNGTNSEGDQMFTTLPGPPGFVPSFTVTPSLPMLAFTPVAFPTETGTTTGATTKGLSRAQKLARALKVCAKDKAKGRRASCEKAARRKYVTAAKGRKK